MPSVVEQILRVATVPEQADFLVAILGEHKERVIAGDLPVVLFGAGAGGTLLCESLRIHGVAVACLCDNNPALVGSRIAGRPVISPEALAHDHRDSLVVVAATTPRAVEIPQQLRPMGFPAYRIRSMPPETLAYYTEVASRYWYPAELEAQKGRLQDAYDLLADERSRQVFVHRMALFAGGFDYGAFTRFLADCADLRAGYGPNPFSSPRYDDDYFYFRSGLFSLADGEVFANVGALVGDCALEFARACEEQGVRYGQILNFEPEAANFARLVENTKGLRDVRCLPFGAWSSPGRMRFSAPAAGAPGWLAEDGGLEVDVARLDDLLGDTPVSLIKMDIEGAEAEALRGAVNLINRYKPRLAISAYHKRDDIVELPLLIQRLCPGYRLFLRHHCTCFGETVLYAVA